MNQYRNTQIQDTTPVSSQRKQSSNGSSSIRKARYFVLISALLLSFFLTYKLLQNQLYLQEIALTYLKSNNHETSFARLASSNPKKYQKELKAEVDNTDKALKAFLPKQSYIVINTTTNHFKLYDADSKLLRDGLVSTGSFTVLKASNNKQWMFKTPRGQLKVLKKTKDPVWKRPDWAFIEEGQKVPSANHPSRFEYGTLGDYSLSLGDGYMIHGTLYKRFLGLPVTHGCIRMGDEDLEDVFNTLKIGSKVYIY